MTYRFFAAAMAAVLWLGAAHQAAAQTISFAEAYDRIAGACGADIRKHCSGVPLGNGQVRTCLANHAAEVSPTCKGVVADVFALLERRMQAQATVRQVCDADIQRLCPGVVQHDGYVLSCMLKASRAVSGACNQTITDAGWR